MLQILFIVVGLLLSLAGCGGGTSENDQNVTSELIKTNMARWEEAGIQNYMFTYSITPVDCPMADPFPSVVITVNNNGVTSVYAPASNEALPTENRRTLREELDYLLAEANKNPVTLSESFTNQGSPPAFDEQYGYPVNYYLDKTTAECDALAVHISNFQIPADNSSTDTLHE